MTESKENLIKGWEWKSNNDEITITKYKGTDEEVIMPSVVENKPVVCIGEDAFSGCSLLTNINLPDSVTEIGKRTFKGCSSLTNISIPDSITEIREDAFDGCPSLVNIPKV